MRSKPSFVFLALVLLAAACGSEQHDTAAPPVASTTTVTASELSAARARWESQGLTSYTFEYERRCFCIPAHYRVTVTEGAVTATEPLSPDTHSTRPVAPSADSASTACRSAWSCALLPCSSG